MSHQLVVLTLSSSDTFNFSMEYINRMTLLIQTLRLADNEHGIVELSKSSSVQHGKQYTWNRFTFSGRPKKRVAFIFHTYRAKHIKTVLYSNFRISRLAVVVGRGCRRLRGRQKKKNTKKKTITTRTHRMWKTVYLSKGRDFRNPHLPLHHQKLPTRNVLRRNPRHILIFIEPAPLTSWLPLPILLQIAFLECFSDRINLTLPIVPYGVGPSENNKNIYGGLILFYIHSFSANTVFLRTYNYKNWT